MSKDCIVTSGDTPFQQDGSRNQSQPEFDVKLAQELLKRTERLQDHSIDIAIRAKESREFLDWHINHLKTLWLDWQEESEKIFKDIQMTRKAIEYESKELLTACRDVRKFFLEPQHTEEVSRLKEFVEVMDRLRTLKFDGTLDAVADTILKLALK